LVARKSALAEMIAWRLLILRRLPSIVAYTGSFSAATNSADKSLRRGPRGLPDWPFWNGLPRGGLP
jgi:hypothetical protein